MKNKRSNEIMETYMSLKENREKLAAEEVKKQNAVKEANENFYNKYYALQSMRNRKEANRSRIMEGARDDALSTVLKAIYITAMEAESLTDEGILLAESMVDNWIEENGGASKILGKVGNDSYLLSRITQICEEAAEKAAEEIEKPEDKPLDDITDDGKADEGTKGSSTNQDAIDAVKNVISNASKEELRNIFDDIQKATNDRKDELKDQKDAEKAADDAEKAKNKAEKAEEKAEKAQEKVEKNEAKKQENSVEEEVPEDAAKEPEAEEDSKEETSDKNQSNDTKEIEKVEDDEEKVDDDLENLKTDEESEEDEENEENDDESSEDKENKEEESDDDEKESDPLAGDLDNDESDESDDDESDKSDESDDEDDNSDSDEDVNLDGEEVDTNNGDSSSKIFDQLSKEEDVKKAIALIRSRVADAEETFIKNNAEDKKKVDELLDKISKNVKTVEDLNDKNNEKSKVSEESLRFDKRKIDEIRNNRTLTVFEAMTRNFSSGILKNEEIKTHYVTESGSLDMDLVVEGAKLMYGFLETINTLNLAIVDANYIKNIIDNM